VTGGPPTNADQKQLDGYAAVAFDWGGVMTKGTFDSSAVVALAALVGTTPEALDDTYLRLMERFEVGEYDLPGFHSRFSAATGTATPIDAFRAAFLGAVRERPAMYALIGSLPANLTVGVLSNNVPELCDVVRDDPRLSRVEAFVFSNEIGVRKPRREAFDALTAALGTPPELTVFVDDNRDNIEACTELGFTGLLIDTPAAFARRWRAALPSIPLPPGFANDD
jgi:putative hydrolase of the HAD superfamily